MECVDPDKIIWDVDFADAHEDFEPIHDLTPGTIPAQASPSSRRKNTNYPCSGTAQVWASESALKCTEANLTAIGSSGAELNGENLPLNEVVLLQIKIGEANLTVKAVIGAQDETSCKAVEFLQIRRGDRRVLQHLVQRLSTGKANL
jgi:hypothetical protein